LREKKQVMRESKFDKFSEYPTLHGYDFDPNDEDMADLMKTPE
jgi:hypothetical protein